jgi:hypothetical protein
MQNLKHHWKKVVCGVAVASVGGVLVYTAIGQSVPTPNLKITPLGTNQVTITVTNGVSWANYELYRRTFLDPLYPWALHVIGAQGQTNFVADIGLLNMSFFEIAVGNDWDQDGIPNFMDANPVVPNVGALTITIDNPLNRAVFD